MGASGIVYAECYEVSGTVMTQNVTRTTQVGEITLDIDGLFEDTGILVGNITDPDNIPITLFHVAKFPKGYQFVTNGDQGFIDIFNPIDSYQDPITGEAVACAWPAYEEITEIAGGNKLFSNVIEVYIRALGTVSYCPENNMNVFELSGYGCFEDGKPKN
jgi:hypothetical protein